MKNMKLAEMMMVGLMTMMGVSSVASAQDYGTRNGGDTLELRFKDIAGDLQGWIVKGGAAGMEFQDPAVTRAVYEEKMLKSLAEYRALPNR